MEQIGVVSASIVTVLVILAAVAVAAFCTWLLATDEAARRRSRLHCFEQGCTRPATHRLRVWLRAERGERVDVMARIIVPAVFCAGHANVVGLHPASVVPRDHRRQITRDLERRFGGVPVDWNRSHLEFRHRWLAWTWRADL